MAKPVNPKPVHHAFDWPQMQDRWPGDTFTRNGLRYALVSSGDPEHPLIGVLVQQ